VTLSVLELQRARKQLKTYCDTRNRGRKTGARWSAREVEECFLISRQGSADSKGRSLPEQVLLKLCYRGDVWHLFLPHAQSGWRPYPPRPEVQQFDQVLEELDQAPLHVHW